VCTYHILFINSSAAFTFGTLGIILLWVLVVKYLAKFVLLLLFGIYPEVGFINHITINFLRNCLNSFPFGRTTSHSYQHPICMFWSKFFGGSTVILKPNCLILIMFAIDKNHLKNYAENMVHLNPLIFSSWKFLLKVLLTFFCGVSSLLPILASLHWSMYVLM
jgi:hypothetical protein